MFRDKKHIFFDLDHTLWDYEASSRETLSELWIKYRLEDKGIDLEKFLSRFKEVNEALWDKYHTGLIEKETIRKERFPTILNSFSGINGINVIEMQEAYIHQCPTKPYLIEGASELLNHLQGRYRLHIITNGFDDIQSVKLESSGITNYFEQVITSESANAKKPEKAIFSHALTMANTIADETIMIGDNPISDIHGAYLSGIDQIFLNPFSLKCSIVPTLEVTSLRELLKVF